MTSGVEPAAQLGLRALVCFATAFCGAGFLVLLMSTGADALVSFANVFFGAISR